ncbi:MAG: hypothetical protein A2W34_02025 [Chloroflexi bacterium RBG_16_64_32]|nr:MAG: hypothetical protein A2W34_02025 [Chloroflexi bacterium RBG_16_64_32]
MFTENGVLIDLEEVGKVVEASDVFTIGFRVFPQRVIIDTRETEEVGPLVQVVEPVDSVEERFHWLGRERPAFAVPQQFSFFVWPHSLEFLEACDVGQRIRDRLRAPERPEVAQMIDEALAELRRLERRSVQQALSGVGYHLLWPQE